MIHRCMHFSSIPCDSWGRDLLPATVCKSGLCGDAGAPDCAMQWLRAARLSPMPARQKQWLPPSLRARRPILHLSRRTWTTGCRLPATSSQSLARLHPCASTHAWTLPPVMQVGWRLQAVYTGSHQHCTGPRKCDHLCWLTHEMPGLDCRGAPICDVTLQSHSSYHVVSSGAVGFVASPRFETGLLVVHALLSACYGLFESLQWT